MLMSGQWAGHAVLYDVLRDLIRQQGIGLSWIWTVLYCFMMGQYSLS